MFFTDDVKHNKRFKKVFTEVINQASSKQIFSKTSMQWDFFFQTEETPATGH